MHFHHKKFYLKSDGYRIKSVLKRSIMLLDEMPVHCMKCNGDLGDSRSGNLLWFSRLLVCSRHPIAPSCTWYKSERAGGVRYAYIKKKKKRVSPFYQNLWDLLDYWEEVNKWDINIFVDNAFVLTRN